MENSLETVRTIVVSIEFKHIGKDGTYLNLYFNLTGPWAKLALLVMYHLKVVHNQ